MREVVMVGAARCAVGRALKGILKNTRPDEMAGAVLSALVERTGIDPAQIEDIRLGCAMPEAEQGMNVARIAQFLAKIPETTTAATVNRFCASGLESVINSCYQIAYGDADLIIAGGVESMSMVPMGGYAPRPHPKLAEEYPEVYTPMGITAENLADQYKISRETQDRFSYESHRRAAKATREGRFQEEIVPLNVQVDGKKIVHDRDETIREDTTLEALAQLKPAFKEGGTVTPGNSSPLTDGASAVLIASKKKARSLGLKPIARFVTAATTGVRPEIMGIAPAYAIPKALKNANLSLKEIDLIEFNEAFAAQALAVIQAIDMPMEKLNVNGGAIALGHALGSSGARLLTTLLYEMPRGDAQFGLVSMCIGGGQGMAAVFERVL
ncbi:thiolase family protein [Candidatus Acetothermia bacterium]|nr:thiolase family protein [Candidatus Acetothermia bacterium]MCI2432592.1 thiolase family protein [Candidatus Acetothermia bacterium]MCI2436870.1 thiolase family protein [Candidatus Acetothermia bacterium]